MFKKTITEYSDSILKESEKNIKKFRKQNEYQSFHKIIYKTAIKEGVIIDIEEENEFYDENYTIFSTEAVSFFEKIINLLCQNQDSRLRFQNTKLNKEYEIFYVPRKLCTISTIDKELYDKIKNQSKITSYLSLPKELLLMKNLFNLLFPDNYANFYFYINRINKLLETKSQFRLVPFKENKALKREFNEILSTKTIMSLKYNIPIFSSNIIDAVQENMRNEYGVSFLMHKIEYPNILFYKGEFLKNNQVVQECFIFPTALYYKNESDSDEIFDSILSLHFYLRGEEKTYQIAFDLNDNKKIRGYYTHRKIQEKKERQNNSRFIKKINYYC